MEQTEKEAAFDQLVAETNATSEAEPAKGGPIFNTAFTQEEDLRRFDWVVELLTITPVSTDTEIGERAAALQAALDLGYEKRQAIDVAMSLRRPKGPQTIDGECAKEVDE